jgi:hypothetical protein
MNEIVNLYLKGEYTVPKTEVIPYIEYYFENMYYFDTTIPTDTQLKVVQDWVVL